MLTMGIIDNLPSIVESGVQIVGSLASGIVSMVGTIGEKVGVLLGCIGDTLKGYLSTAKNMGKDIISHMADGLASMVSTVKERLSSIITAFSDVWGDIKTSALTWGKDIIGGLIDGIKSKVTDVTDAVKEVAGDIASFLHFSVPDEGPLTSFPEWMPDMMKGLAQGITKNMKYVENAVSGLASAMIPEFDLAPALSQYDASRLKLPEIQQGRPGQSGGGQPTQGGRNVFNITITVDQMNSDYDVRRAAEVMAQEIDRLTQDNNSLKGAWSV